MSSVETLKSSLVPCVKSLYNTGQKFSANAVKDFLRKLPSEDVFAIANTATSRKLFTEDLEEAIDMILHYTPDIDRFFSYRRITSQLLTHYLFIYGRQLKVQSTRTQLVSIVIDIWVKNFPNENSQLAPENNEDFSHSQNAKSNYPNAAIDNRLSYSSIPTGENMSRQFEKIKSNVFAYNYAKWFYSLLNQINQSDRGRLPHEIFCTNSSLDIYLVNTSSTFETHCQNSNDCAVELFNVIKQHSLSFSPNVENGIQAFQNPHGLVRLCCCGTLHVAANFVGIFEQEFGLVKNPTDKTWQIFYTKINLKQGASELPALPSCPVFEIDNT